MIVAWSSDMTTRWLLPPAGGAVSGPGLPASAAGGGACAARLVEAMSVIDPMPPDRQPRKKNPDEEQIGPVPHPCKPLATQELDYS
jgi:hypothetical protein